MNKNLVSLSIVIFLIIGYFFNIDILIQKRISIFKNNISESIITIKDTISTNINRYFNQVDYIKELEAKNSANNIYKIKYNITKNRLDEQNILLNLSYDHNLSYQSVKILSYLNFNDNSKVVIESIKNINKNKIYPLVTYDGYSSGILVDKKSQNIGYLNNNIKCNYTVFIGKDKAPGITHGVDDYGNLLINYIPLWKNIKIDDEIITSGMDDIFPFGIKVGKVISVQRGKINQKIVATTYAQYIDQRYLYLIK